MRQMDALMKEASQFVSTLPSIREGSAVHCQPCKSLKYGEFCIPRQIATSIRTQLSAEGALTEGDQLTLISKYMYSNDVFTHVKFNPQGQLCLSLNRVLTFRKSIMEVLEKCVDYGHTDAICNQPTLLIDCYTRLHSARDDLGVVMTGSPPHQPLSVSEGRMLLVKKLLQILSRTGNCVKEGQSKEGLHIELKCACSTSDLVKQLLLSYDFENVTLSPSPTYNDIFMSGMEASPYLTHSKESLPLLFDGKRFLQERGLASHHGYGKNINMIEVKAKDGSVSGVSSRASAICQLHSRLAGEHSHVKMIHITSHSLSFKQQQAMVLAQSWVESHAQGPKLRQHLIPCSDVNVIEDGVAVKDYPFTKLLQIRHRQMMSAYEVKYGSKSDDVGVQAMVKKTTEAVVKFELLSSDPQTKIKLTVSSQQDSGMDVRFTGSFVLYNYARLANLVTNFEKACKLGTYPPLPSLHMIDFSLLNDEAEWQILFHYVLHYPLIVREITTAIGDSATIFLDIKLKKICQFLTQLSHLVSTYYSRVKVLLAPEPHLVPLIHARLLLVMTIKQIMYNALQLLAIEPPEQL